MREEKETNVEYMIFYTLNICCMLRSCQCLNEISIFRIFFFLVIKMIQSLGCGCAGWGIEKIEGLYVKYILISLCTMHVLPLRLISQWAIYGYQRKHEKRTKQKIVLKVDLMRQERLLLWQTILFDDTRPYKQSDKCVCRSSNPII